MMVCFMCRGFKPKQASEFVKIKSRGNEILAIVFRLCFWKWVKIINFHFNFTRLDSTMIVRDGNSDRVDKLFILVNRLGVAVKWTFEISIILV